MLMLSALSVLGVLKHPLHTSGTDNINLMSSVVAV